VGLPVIRKDVDNTCGHCFQPVVFIEGSPDVIVNSHPVVRKGDHIRIHCCGQTCHVGAAIGNGSGVYANGRPIQVQTNSLTCGDTSCNGSGDTFSGP
jgi:uncharacterized Zn-binding protein involved in type VI secretion